MKPYRGHAIAVGVLLLACTVTSVLSAVSLGSTLEGHDYLQKLGTADNRVVVTALIEFLWAATGARIAIALYPVIRQHNRALALGAVVRRVIEAVFILIGTLSLLVLLSVSQKSLADPSAASAFGVTGDALLAVRDWTSGFVVLLAFLSGALMYYYVLYASRLIPRWLSGWGLVAVAMAVVATIYAGLTQDFGFTTVNTVMNAPILLQELVLAVWLIVKGFNPLQVDADHEPMGDDATPVTVRLRWSESQSS
jgi:hypothetical protein